MKNYIIVLNLFIWYLLVSPKLANAQFTSGSLFHIGPGTDVSIDGLLLRPTFANFAMSDKTIQVSAEPIAGSPHGSIKRVYSFNEPINFSGSVGIHYALDDLNGNLEQDLQIAYFNDAEKWVTTSGGTADASKNRVSQTFFGKDLLKVTAVSGNSVLPVTLVSFSAKAAEGQSVLAWNTTTETNSDFFEIQRSTTGKNWEVLGKVESAGESKILHSYTFRDNEPAPGSNLYRLRMVDNDGSYAYSQIRNVTFEAGMSFKVFPNPVASQLQLSMGDWSQVESVSVINKLGVIVRELKAAQLKGSSKKEMDVQGLPTGTYVVKMTFTDGTSETNQIFKE